ncbi:MAG: tetratricopeptide repeat protein, partial [Terriglobales bacterium]
NSDSARLAWEEAAKGGKRIHGAGKAFQAAALMKLGRSEESEKLATSLLESASKSSPGAPAFYAVGLMEALRGNSDVAKQYFQRALEADPSFWQARIELGR